MRSPAMTAAPPREVATMGPARSAVRNDTFTVVGSAGTRTVRSYRRSPREATTETAPGATFTAQPPLASAMQRTAGSPELVNATAVPLSATTRTGVFAGATGSAGARNTGAGAAAH